MSSSPSVSRLFRDLTEGEVADAEKMFLRSRLGLSTGFNWDTLLASERILIVSEAGAGKTYECQNQKDKLWAKDEPAFFLDLATLALSSVRDMLSAEEEKRFDQWSHSQAETATFFLDSIDELELTLGKFDQALKRLSKALAGQLGRARIIITTRPVPIDRELIERYLPIPAPQKASPTAEAFANMVMEANKQKVEKKERSGWRNVSLMPLQGEQILQFAALQGVPDPGALLADLRARDAEEFAERPQDLIELCSDWREHHRIRSHRDQIISDISTKLKPRINRQEKAELSESKAFEGASRLALASILTRRLTLRFSAGSDRVHSGHAALDPFRILRDWNFDEVITLLQRPLFGFATYGRVRFHHRSVIEFLAAKRLEQMLDRGASIKSIKRLLLTETERGTRAVRPSMRSVAAWLGLSRETIFEELIELDPSILLMYGDPQSLRLAQKVGALKAYVDHYGHGGWRGLTTPSIQVHRFASTDLAEVVEHLWKRRIENVEVRGLLLRIMAAGKLGNCADIAFVCATDLSNSISERTLAIRVLLNLKDYRVPALVDSIETDPIGWPDEIVRQIAIDFFPEHLDITRLLTLLLRVKESRQSLGALNYWLPRKIETEPLKTDYIDQLRQGLTDLILNGISWDDRRIPHLSTPRQELVPSLIAACCRQAIEGYKTEPWIFSSLLAIRLSNENHRDRDALARLRNEIEAISLDARELAFWREDGFLQGLHIDGGTWERLFELTRFGGIRLSKENDGQWVRSRLLDKEETPQRREMMLWVEIQRRGNEGNKPIYVYGYQHYRRILQIIRLYSRGIKNKD
ncbi:MAG: hypothetical protein ACLQL2_05680, partial [Methylovirgula sp.]